MCFIVGIQYKSKKKKAHKRSKFVGKPSRYSGGPIAVVSELLATVEV